MTASLIYGASAGALHAITGPDHVLSARLPRGGVRRGLLLDHPRPLWMSDARVPRDEKHVHAVREEPDGHDPEQHAAVGR